MFKLLLYLTISYLAPKAYKALNTKGFKYLDKVSMIIGNSVAHGGIAFHPSTSHFHWRWWGGWRARQGRWFFHGPFHCATSHHVCSPNCLSCHQCTFPLSKHIFAPSHDIFAHQWIPCPHDGGWSHAQDDGQSSLTVYYTTWQCCDKPIWWD